VGWKRRRSRGTLICFGLAGQVRGTQSNPPFVENNTIGDKRKHLSKL